jgi:nucleoside-diphosphate-sugar epimerase
MAQSRVLLTGANGSIGSHILQLFLDKSIFVPAVVRSEAKARKIQQDFPGIDKSKLDFSIVPDITAPGAFDQCLKDAQPLDAIVHTASPFNYSIAKTLSDFIEPAVRGTTEILQSAAEHAPGLKRFVITGSFAAIGNVFDLQGNGRLYSSDVWNPVTKDQTATMELASTYWASKTFAEQAGKSLGSFTVLSASPSALYPTD